MWATGIAGRWLAASAVVGALLPAAASPASGQATTWSIVPSPSPAAQLNELDGGASPGLLRGLFFCF